MEENKVDIDAIVRQAIDWIKDFLRKDWNLVGDIAEESGMTADEIFKVLYAENVSIENVVCLYNTIQKKIDDKTVEILSKMDSDEAIALLNAQLKDVREYVRASSNDVSDISLETGLSTDEVLNIVFAQGDRPSPRISQIYGAVQRIIKKKTDAIIAKNPLSEESAIVINQKHEDVKIVIKSNPNIALELAQDSGIPTDEVFRIAYINPVVPASVVSLLHAAAQRVQNAKAQEIEERNKVM